MVLRTWLTILEGTNSPRSYNRGETHSEICQFAIIMGTASILFFFFHFCCIWRFIIVDSSWLPHDHIMYVLILLQNMLVQHIQKICKCNQANFSGVACGQGYFNTRYWAPSVSVHMQLGHIWHILHNFFVTHSWIWIILYMTWTFLLNSITNISKIWTLCISKSGALF